MTMRSKMKIKMLYLLIVAIAIAACSNEKSEQASPDISSDEPMDLSSEVHTYTVKYADFMNEIEVPATVDPLRESVSVVSTMVSGIVGEIHKHEGEFVRKGDPLITLRSLELSQLIYDFRQAANDTELLKIQVERLKGLTDKNISSQREYEEALIRYKNSQNQMNRYENKLEVLSINPDKFLTEDSKNDKSKIILRSDISGYIKELNVTHGESVETYDKLMTIINPSQVLIRAFITPEDAMNVKIGDEMKISTLKDKYLGNLSTKIRSIQPTLDDENKSVVVNAVLKTSDGFPKPGQTVRVNIVSGTKEQSLLIPNSAIMFEQETGFVYVKENGIFKKRNIVIKNRNVDSSFISSGLKDGEIIAATNVLSIKSEFRLQEEEGGE